MMLSTPKIQRIPQTMLGRGSTSNLATIEAQHIMILVAGSIKATEKYQKTKQSLQQKIITEHTVEHCTKEEIEKIAKADKPEAIVAIGGGSVIDTAKLVRQVFENGSISAEGANHTIQLIAVPTTPATGSEVSSVAVYTEAKAKKPVVGPSLIPDMAILDSTWLATLSKEQLFDSAADIFSHSYEASVSKLTNDIVKAYSDAALKLLEQALATEQPNTEKLLYAGHLAGVSQTNAFVGACHALGHSLETISGISHSHAMLLLIKPCLEWHYEKTSKPEFKSLLEIYERIGFEQYCERKPLLTIPKQEWASMALADPSVKTNPVIMNQQFMEELIQWIQTRA